jgi:hypothetical protein
MSLPFSVCRDFEHAGIVPLERCDVPAIRIEGRVEARGDWCRWQLDVGAPGEVLAAAQGCISHDAGAASAPDMRTVASAPTFAAPSEPSALS